MGLTPTGNDWMDGLGAICESVRFSSDKTFSWHGTDVPYPSFFHIPITQDPHSPEVVGQVAYFIYDRFYRRPDPTLGYLIYDPSLRVRFSQKLNRIRAQAAQQVESSRASECDAIVPVTSILDSSRVGPQIQQGWYYATGGIALPGQSTQLIRLYWNICYPGSGALLYEVVKDLDAARIPFTFKILDDPSAFGRADAAVVYMPSIYWEDAWSVVVSIREKIRGYLCRPTPMFTKTLAPGLGFSEDPMNGESFGTHRSQLVAQGLWHASIHGETRTEDIIERVLRVFEKSGVPRRRPYTHKWSRFDYGLESGPKATAGAIN
jgi:hypothetical protein